MRQLFPIKSSGLVVGGAGMVSDSGDARNSDSVRHSLVARRRRNRWRLGLCGRRSPGVWSKRKREVASPFLLYYLYVRIGPQFSGPGTSLSSRQRFKQRLGNATLNPRGADAHYQLGLIYAQRRQFADAGACFCRTI